MESETYRKIGRGGAGNYYSKQDVEEAARRAAEVRVGNSELEIETKTLSISKLCAKPILGP